MTHWRLSTRIVAVSLALLLLVQLASLGVIHTGVERNARTQLAQSLQQAEQVWHRLVQQRAQKLEQGARLLAADYGFRSAVVAGDVQTLASVLDNHGARIGASLAALLDTRQQLVAHTYNGQDAQAMASLHAILGELTKHGEAVAMVGNQAYQFVMVPLKAPVMMGWVVMGFAFDKQVLADMHAITGQHVALLAPAGTPLAQQGRMLHSTLGLNTAAADQTLTQSSELVWHGDTYLLRRVPVDNHGEVPASLRVDAVVMGSLSSAVAPYRPVQLVLILITVGGLLLFTVGSLLMARRVAKPLKDLVDVSDKLAKGHYDDATLHMQRRDEVGDLAKAFDHMRLSIANQQQQIRQLAFWDRLTGLPNRVQFRDALMTALVEHQTSPARTAPLAILMLDLNRFKHINDVLGYRTGDQVLQRVAERLASAVSPSQLLARVGGDEFGVLLPHCDRAQALQHAQRMLAVLDEPLVIDEQTIDLAAGLGVACFPAHGDDADVLLSRVEIAMYAAKRDTHLPLVYDPGQDAGSLQTLSLISDLRQALDQDQLRLYLQPKIDLMDGRLVGAEALVRWAHPSRGLVPPMSFIPFAEQTGFIRKLTLWIFEACAAQQIALARLGLSRLSVNLSTRDLLDQELPTKFMALLERHGAHASAFCLEITESAIMDDPQRAEATLNHLADAGFQLSIDDFGTGYSSLAYLKRLPVHELKIDQSFVKAMTTSAGDVKIVQSTIDLAHNLGLRVVAEGVENEGIAQSLQQMLCDEAQGYWYAKPMPVDAFTAWAQNWVQANPLSGVRVRKPQPLEHQGFV